MVRGRGFGAAVVICQYILTVQDIERMVSRSGVLAAVDTASSNEGVWRLSAAAVARLLTFRWPRLYIIH